MSAKMPEAGLASPLGIFGGTFDPVHFGHLRLAEAAADALGLPRVRWIPAGQPPARAVPPLASARQRLAMVQLAIAHNMRFELDPGEVEVDQPSFTVVTLERLRRPDVCGSNRPLVLLAGADAFAGMGSWHRWQRLFELAHVAVACRPGYSLQADQLPPAMAEQFRQRFCDDPAALAESPAGCIVPFAMTPLGISATHLRGLLSKGYSPRYLLPDAVLDHIHQHSLYQEH
jgi:nicotinate-nucleotide adenylyltransferase